MTYLTLNSHLRTETNAEIISNLVRKGWVEIQRPSETAQWVGGEWVEPPPVPPADAEMWQVRVWLARQGVNPASIPAIIESMTEDGPERWEALERWHTVTLVPITHQMVPMLWAVVGPGLGRELTLEQAWEEILAI